MTLREMFVAAKTGRDEDCEDVAVVSADFAAVLDGCTRKSAPAWQGTTPGRLAASRLGDVIRELPPSADIGRVVGMLTQSLTDCYSECGVLDDMMANPGDRLAATAAIFSDQRREVWLIGDCQCRIGETVHQHKMQFEQILSDLRAIVLSHAIMSGKSEAELAQVDVGRQSIEPYLKMQSAFQNLDGDSPFGYAAIDGFPIPPRYWCIVPVPEDTSEIILASDGYPYVGPTLAETEAAQAQILKADPLLFNTFRATKGLMQGQHSFDDRAYLRVAID
jgi:hypothetical protein